MKKSAVADSRSCSYGVLPEGSVVGGSLKTERETVQIPIYIVSVTA